MKSVPIKPFFLFLAITDVDMLKTNKKNKKKIKRSNSFFFYFGKEILNIGKN